MKTRRNDSAGKMERDREQRHAEGSGQRSETSACEPWRPIDFEGPDTSLTQADLEVMK
jgi:hypothetical protein